MNAVQEMINKIKGWGKGDMVRIGYELLHWAARDPLKAHPSDVGWDVCAARTDEFSFSDRRTIPLGIRLEIPEGYEVQVRLRSSIGARGFIIPNGIGTIDPNYRGEIFLPLIYMGHGCEEIREGERIAQLIVCPIINTGFFRTDVNTNTDRGEGGCGSSGRF